MTTLIFGVVDVAYSSKDGGSTTGEVASILEKKYHVMRTFLELNESEIGDLLAKKMVERMTANYRSRTQMQVDRISTLFRDFLNADEMSKVLPTSMQSAAAMAGVNHRKKHPYAKANSERPAFIDTGLYQQSFRAVLTF